MKEITLNKNGRSGPNTEIRRPIRCVETGQIWTMTKDWLDDMRLNYGSSYRASRQALLHDTDIDGLHYERVETKKQRI